MKAFDFGEVVRLTNIVTPVLVPTDLTPSDRINNLYYYFSNDFKEKLQDLIKDDLIYKNLTKGIKEKLVYLISHALAYNIYDTHKKYVLMEEAQEAHKSFIEKSENEGNLNISPVLAKNIKESCINLIMLKKRNEAIEIIVLKLKTLTKFYALRDDDKDEIWVYENGIYVPNGITYIQEFCRLILSEQYTSAFGNSVTDRIKVDSYINQEEFFKVKNPDEIPVQNGILNIKTKELSSFTETKIFLNKLPVAFEPGKDCPAIKKFISDIVEDPRDIITIQQLLGYLLYKDYKYERMFMLTGDGRNGKGKFGKLIETFIGHDNCISLQPSIFENPGDFEISGLYGKMANLSMDINAQNLKNTGFLKSLSGRDGVTCKRKFKSAIHFTNYAKLIFASNQLPIVHDDKNGIWTRWILLNFPYTFINEKLYNALEKHERARHKVEDVEIIEKITTIEELTGLLNWALEGFESLERNGGFIYRFTQNEVCSMWIRKTDSFNAFCKEMLDENENSKITKDELRRVFKMYCQDNKLKGATDKYISQFLERELNIYDTETMTHGESIRYWQGLRFSNNRNRIVDGLCFYAPPVNEFEAFFNTKVSFTIEEVETFFNDKKEAAKGYLDVLVERGKFMEVKPGKYQSI